MSYTADEVKRSEPTLRLASRHRSPSDGWLGTPELPGYRAGDVVARLADMPTVDPDHLYFNLLLLDCSGQLQDHHSGPCHALSRQQPFDDRSRFVRVVAELVRHAPSADRGLTGIGQALDVVRERGVTQNNLMLAAQLVDDACSEGALVASLTDMLELSFGVEEAQRLMADVLAGLQSGPANPALADLRVAAAGGDGEAKADAMDGLAAQVAHLVRVVGKVRSRRHLRETLDFPILPSPELLGV